MLIEKNVYISYIYTEIPADNSCNIYLIETDNKNCLRNKFVLHLDRYNSIEDSHYKQGLYKVIYNTDDIKRFEPIPLISFKEIIE